MFSMKESLKEECLFLITEKFERYYKAFKLSRGTVLEKHFEFLERAFSETIFHSLKDDRRLKSKYFEFLINPYIRNLNLQHIEEELVPPLVDRLQAVENKVVSLKTEFYGVETDCFKQLISSIPKVEVIEIDGYYFPEVLEQIGKTCASLRVLKISCYIDGTGLMNIFKNADNEYEEKACLEQLDLEKADGCELLSSDEIYFVLSHAPSLKCLGYPNIPRVLYEKHKSDLENNSTEELKKYSLTSLKFPSVEENMLDSLKICTAVCPDVSSLSICGLENDEQLLLCSKFHHLKDVTLSVGVNYFSFEGITQFLKLRGKGLISIHLENACVPADVLVKYCPKLRSLKLKSVNYKPLDTKEYLFSKGKLSYLKTLTISNSDLLVKEVDDSVKLILSNAKNVSIVNFSYTVGFTEDFVKSLSQLSLFEVRELNLRSTDINVSTVEILLSRGSLQRMCLANCPKITEIDYFNLLECNNNVEITLDAFDSFSDGDSFDDDYDYDFDNNDLEEYDEYLEYIYMGYDYYNEYDDFDEYNDPDMYDDFSYNHEDYI